MGITGSQQSFEILAEAGLPVIVPAPLAAKYKYDVTSGKLAGKGIMSDAERVKLKALAAANGVFAQCR